ncbi:MAG: STAS domain-containing protein [Ignavibacteriaceae bacterium]|nr:STAS domain-containing protein [Ignavibacteriaceae bacterium]
MKISIIEREQASIIKIESNQMLGYEAQDFHDAIHNSLEKNKKKIVIDLSNLQFISSWGIGILIHGYTTVNNKEGNFILAAVPDIVNDSLKKTKLDTVFSKYGSVDEALNA